MIKGLKVVALMRDCPDDALAAGDTGTFVHIYADGTAVEVEFTTLDGKTLAVQTLPPADLQPIRAGEIAHAVVTG